MTVKLNGWIFLFLLKITEKKQLFGIKSELILKKNLIVNLSTIKIFGKPK